MANNRSFWLSLSLFNLCIVALLGLTLRSKILFSLPFIDFRNVLSAHSHFAFAGWVGLALITMLIYDLLPEFLSQKKIYQWILSGLAVSALGMAFLFPVYGYNSITIFFSSLYVLVILVFVPVFINDILIIKSVTIKLLAISAVASMVLSFLGTIGLTYIIVAQKGGALLYRDSIYTFLHFQYNGFFTLSIFALFFNHLLKKNIKAGQNIRIFSKALCFSIIPSLFLSLLWHNSAAINVLAAAGCVGIIISLLFFLRILKEIRGENVFQHRLSRLFWIFLSLSFCLKMILNVGTIFPSLGNAVYGDRPVIIGFLHLIFLGFVSFYILGSLIESDYFTQFKKVKTVPFAVFSFGIIANECLLMLQGLGILLKTNSDAYKWLLWGVSILLFAGALLIFSARLYVIRWNKKSHRQSMA